MQQEIHALDIIGKKKNGSVNLKAINEYGENNPFAVLDPKTIPELMNILKVNHIDFWRIIKRFYGSRQYIELKNVNFKRSIKKAAGLINDYKEFFIRPESTTINYGQDVSDIIADIKCARIIFKN